MSRLEFYLLKIIKRGVLISSAGSKKFRKINKRPLLYYLPDSIRIVFTTLMLRVVLLILRMMNEQSSLSVKRTGFSETEDGIQWQTITC